MYLASGRNSKVITQIMDEFKQDKRVIIPDDILQQVKFSFFTNVYLF